MKVSSNAMGLLAALLAIVFLAAVNEVFADEIYISGGIARSFNSDYSIHNGVSEEDCGWRKESRGSNRSGGYGCNQHELFRQASHSFGQLEIGYRHDIWEGGHLVGALQHTSSLGESDKGLNLILIKLEHAWQLK